MHSAAIDHVRIPIRTLRILGPNDRETVQHTVHCPHRGRCVPLEACRSCPGSASIHWDPLERESYLRCRRDAALTSRAGGIVADVMTTHVLCVYEDTRADELLALLVERQISGVPVVDLPGRPLGVVSMTDLLRERYDALDLLEQRPGSFDDLADTPPAGGPVRDLMTRRSVTATEDLPLTEAAALMVRHAIKRLPVVSEDGVVVGIVSTLDLLEHFAGRPPPVRAGA